MKTIVSDATELRATTRCPQQDRHPGKSAIVLVRRGICTFVEKAKNVQHALGSGAANDAEIGAKTQQLGGGVATGDLGEIQTSTARGGMVLVNGEDTLADMPAGQLLTDDVDIPVAMQVNHSDICLPLTMTDLGY